MTTTLKLSGRWDCPVAPAGETVQRGLLLEVSAASRGKRADRRPVNLALVIDRSGSMSGGGIQAAKGAAIEVIERLSQHDALSIVAFDNEIDVLVSGLSMSNAGKSEAISSIRGLNARGTTDLAGGWFEGARCVSSVMDTQGLRYGHVVVLSDGRANQGLQKPLELQQHAAELAQRGVTSSCVGVGNGYSPIQLDAIAEGGRGRLHDAESPQEMATVILAELGEVLEVAATEASVQIKWPEALRGVVVANYFVEEIHCGVRIHLGNLGANVTRMIPVVFECPRTLELGEIKKIKVSVRARAASDGAPLQEVRSKFALEVGSSARVRDAGLDESVVERIAGMWSASLSYEAMRLNEGHDYRGASHRVRQYGQAIRQFVAGTASAIAINHQLDLAESRVSAHWDSRSKREAMVRAKKFGRSELDYRASKPAASWSEELDR